MVVRSSYALLKQQFLLQAGTDSYIVAPYCVTILISRFEHLKYVYSSWGQCVAPTVYDV